MDRFRNPNPRGESFSSLGRGGELTGDDDDVEGHTMTYKRLDEDQGSIDDVEGHATNPRATEDDDVEGHAINPKATEDEDVEEHIHQR